jgi:UDPglucose 6-dehydrogenase
MKIGLIGCGFVGGAIKRAYETYGIDILVYDPYVGYDIDFELIKSCDVVFISVPSPIGENGQCDTSIFESTLEQLQGSTATLISKVTAPPSVYRKLQTKYNNLVHAPEFLVAVTADKDYLEGTFAFIGGDLKHCQQAKDAIVLGQRFLTDIKFCSIEEASMAKYTINTFLALKVSYLNQIYDLCANLDVDYNNVQALLASEVRLGASHMNVPGPDGERGYGGACFPKDTQALLFEASKHNTQFDILSSAVNYNNIVRKIK